ncbi:MAG: fumarylacetoacetate hydrolase family protein [Candidatus Kaistia colombiensis]|nr:MAG: fumarylacetoacetate hydrolase family protein [Kaistia sp.]
MSNRLFADPQYPAVPVTGEDSLYPVHRIFCVGRNYAEHAKEMGVEVDREEPFYFLKDAQSLVQTGATIAYPPGTANYHYEMEFVIAIGAPAFKVPVDAASAAIFGYACGLDMTRRDLQLNARAKSRPWDFGKNFEQSTIMAPITRATAFAEIGPQEIVLDVNGERRQAAHLDDLVWNVPEIVSHLSHYYHLQPGDLIFTGTPAGVGAVVAGDVLRGSITGLADVELAISKAES